MSVVDLVKDIGKFFQINDDKARIDNIIFQAHYRLTTSIFFIASIFLTAFSLLGDPIHCQNNVNIDPKVMNSYCWISHTYTWINSSQTIRIHPGVGPSENAHEGNKRYHSYYQWVPFILFFHGLCFYLPHWIWKTWEGGKVKMMSEDIRGTALTDNDSKRNKRELVVDFLIATRKHHKKYAYTYFTCEILNLLNTIMTAIIIDSYLGRVFLDYGFGILNFTLENQDDRSDVLTTIFPRVTKCSFKTYGLSGSQQNLDALCILPLNNFNEIFYIFLWFWLLFLGCITFCSVAYSVAFLTLPDIRRLVITKRFRFGTKYEVNELIRQIGVGDFLLLHLLGQNLSTVTFHQLLEDLNNKLLYPTKSRKAIQGNADDYKANSDTTTSLYPNYMTTMKAMDLDNTKEPLIVSLSSEKPISAV